MHILHWERLSGAIAPQAMLEELGVSYDMRHIDMGGMAQRTAPYAALCPTQRVPALSLPEGITIGESAAILLTLGERRPEAGLVPAIGDDDRPTFLYWLMFMATTGYPTVSRAWHPEQFTNDDIASEAVRVAGEDDLIRFFDIVEGAISEAPRFLRRGFTALDFYLAMLTEWLADMDALFARCPLIGALCTAVTARPAYAKVMRAHHGEIATAWGVSRWA